jgi:hypothetical protein
MARGVSPSMHVPGFPILQTRRPVLLVCIPIIVLETPELMLSIAFPRDRVLLTQSSLVWDAQSGQPSIFTHTCCMRILHLPLLVLRVLGANDVDIFATLSPHTLAAITQLLDRAAHLHSSDLLAHSLGRRVRRCDAELFERSGD